jgi:hypothetical protein
MRFAPLVAALAAVFAISSASATTVLIDGFDYGTFAPINSPVTTGPTNISGFPLSGIATDRTVTLATTQTGSGGTFAAPSAYVFDSVYNYSSGPGWNGTSTITWTIPANSFVSNGGPVALYFDILFSNSGNPFDPLSNKVVFGGTALGGVPISSYLPVTSTSVVNQYTLTSGQVTSLLAGGTLTATFSGLPAYDIQLDNFGLALPEPTSLALVGLALVGAGIATRRRGA